MLVLKFLMIRIKNFAPPILTLFFLSGCQFGGTKIVPAFIVLLFLSRGRPCLRSADFYFFIVKSNFCFLKQCSDEIGLSNMITKRSQLPLSTIQSCISLVVVGHYRVHQGLKHIPAELLPGRLGPEEKRH